MTPSAAQFRAARALLDRGQAALASAAGLPIAVVKNVESGANDEKAIATLQRVLEGAGIVFLERDGVQRAGPESQAEPTESKETASTSAPQAHALPELMNIREVVAFVQVHRCTIYEWVNQGKFPKGVKMGEKVVRWRREDVLAWFGALAKYE